MFIRKKTPAGPPEVPMPPKHDDHKAWELIKAQNRIARLEAAIRAHRDIALATYENAPRGTVEMIPRHVNETLWSILDDFFG